MCLRARAFSLSGCALSCRADVIPQTGVGRTGKTWGYQNFDVEPDVITSAKVRDHVVETTDARDRKDGMFFDGVFDQAGPFRFQAPYLHR